jgi:two-component system, cell cycle response regulator
MNEQLLKRVRECPNLPSLPTIAVQVLEVAKKSDADITEIARLISKDPALSGKILKTVNSSFYGRSQHVSTISHALVILGLQSVKTLVLGFSLVSNLTRGKGLEHMAYWRHSIFAATAARIVASKAAVVQQEEAFLIALLMDIGLLVLDQVLGEQYGEIHSTVTSHEDLAAAELAAIQATHAEVGSWLAGQWKLPPILTAPIEFHHDPDHIPDAALKKLAQAVWLGGRCADVFVDKNAAPAIAAVRQRATEWFQWSEADTDVLMNEIGSRTKEVASLFEINIGGGNNFEAILKKANEALVDLTLQSQMQQKELKERNVQLQREATMDGLTGLFNRAHFDRYIAEQFTAAASKGESLSLIMLDLDTFKAVNDKYGHPAGDQVLRTVSKLLKSAARPQDLAARFGGEEMCLVLPGTARAVAAVIAESVRRAVAGNTIRVGKMSLKVTTSIGLATFEPGCPFQQPAHLLKAADLAVYAAKKAGRNCVRVFSLPAAAQKAA